MSPLSQSHPPFRWPVRVYYEDTDAGGVVFYANYLKFMERARTEWLRALGCEQGELRARETVLFAVRRVLLDYRAPARLDDLLTVETRVIRLRGASLDFEQQVRRQADGVLCCAGTVGVACLDADSLRAARIPASVLRVFESLKDGFAE